MSGPESDEAMERFARRRPALYRRAMHRPASNRGVFGEIARRAALPWWRRSFTHWPAPARAAFALVCAALVGVTILGGASAFAGLRAPVRIRRPHRSTGPARSGCSWPRAGNLIALLARVVPASRLYEGVAACAVLYAILFGLGAALYRTLYLQPLNGR